MLKKINFFNLFYLIIIKNTFYHLTAYKRIDNLTYYKLVVIMDKLLNINPIILALIATMFTYLMNFIGSCTVLLFKNVSKKNTRLFFSIWG